MTGARYNTYNNRVFDMATQHPTQYMSKCDQMRQHTSTVRTARSNHRYVCYTLCDDGLLMHAACLDHDMQYAIAAACCIRLAWCVLKPSDDTPHLLEQLLSIEA